MGNTRALSTTTKGPPPHLALPPDPRPSHDPPHLDLPAPEIPQLEALHLNLATLPALLPSPYLLLRAIPIHDDSDVVRLADVDGVLLMHGAAVALKAGVAEGDDVTRPDLVELGDGGVGEVGVDESAVGAGADGEQGVGQGGKEVEDEGVRAAVADGAVLLAFGRLGDAGAELGVGGLELVLAGARGRGLVALLEGGVGGVSGVEAGGDDGLRVVHEEDVDDLRGGGISASFG